MKLIGRNKTKNNNNIASEWDLIAESRAEQLTNQKDISMDHVLIPFIIQSMSDAALDNVIDIGCGTGYATSRYGEKIKNLTGIDISTKSISEAIKNCKRFPNFKFINSCVEAFSINTTEKFSLGIANMTLMGVVNLDDVIKSATKVLLNDSLFIITITHPFFWPFYWGYNNESWFNYTKEIEIEGSFNISLDSSNYITTHYHRPIEMYLNTLVNNDFQIIKLSEPLPNQEIQRLYPRKWEFPRFLGILCKKIAKTTPTHYTDR
jgi:SAM-dependent methyltransferase